MNKFLRISAMIAACFALSATAQGEGTSNSATTTDTSAMSSGQAAVQDSESIKQVQEQLRSKGYPVGRVDGNLGPRTSQALRDFQSSQGIAATGQLDQQTMTALNASGTTGMTDTTIDTATGTTSPTTGSDTAAGSGSTTGTTTDETSPMGSDTTRQGRSPTDTTTTDETSPQGESTGQ